MRKAIPVGVLVFMILIVVRIPAGVIQWIVPDDSQATLLRPQGTLWSGNAELIIQGTATGMLSWQVRPVTFLKGRIGYDVQLAGAGVDLDGQLETGFSSADGSISGSVEGGFVNRWLAPYHIELSGGFDVLAVNLQLEGRSLKALGGRLTWDGGPIRYRLSGNVHNSALPPMTADLGPGPEAVAYATGETIPLLHAALADNGFARIGVTKYLTVMLGQPWPGGDPDHAVVLEVEEQVF